VRRFAGGLSLQRWEPIIRPDLCQLKGVIKTRRIHFGAVLIWWTTPLNYGLPFDTVWARYTPLIKRETIQRSSVVERSAVKEKKAFLTVSEMLSTIVKSKRPSTNLQRQYQIQYQINI